jgi:hypothetical protein
MLGPIKVLGIKHRIALNKPLCGATVQLAAAALQQRVVDGIPNESMGKQEFFSFGPHEKMRDQALKRKVWLVKEVG